MLNFSCASDFHSALSRALYLDNAHVNTLCNYGWLLHDFHRDYDKAEKFYKRVTKFLIEIVFSHVDHVSDYC